ncbi:lysozyme inhibitor LprI family protein [Acinetobacter radioresistens]|uniref:lysozyme inhibitor LprI family protein n=1 Tax=Acinetobacter radioresistens TaxID=40216 RepID=UPI003265AA15
MKKLLALSMLSCIAVLGGCDGFKNKDKQDQAAVQDMADWSCTNQDNLNQIQKYLKSEYLKEVEKNLRQSDYYEADRELLAQINQSLRFEVKNVRTVTEDPKNANQLNCESQLVVHFPKGLLQRAENAYQKYLENCEECEGGTTIADYLEEGESGLSLNNNQLRGTFSYDISKTDKEGLSLDIPNQNAVIDGVVFVTVKAVQYAAYVKENQEIQNSIKESVHENTVQTELAQKAMDIRKKELDTEKQKQVERLNQIWDSLTEEQRTQLKQDQSNWFEKRDVDCKVISQRSVYQIPEAEREVYQKQSNYWDKAMEQQNQDMQYTKCFNQKTAERSVYLNNLF